MKKCKKKIIAILRGILNLILLLITWVSVGIILSTISVIFNISMDVLMGIVIGIVLILFGIFDIFLIKKLFKNLKKPFKIIGYLGIVALFYIGISLLLEAIIVII